MREPIPRAGRADLPARAAEDFAGDVSARLPIVRVKAQFDRASFILSEQFDSARANALGPFIADSLALRKIARSRDDQLWLDSFEKLLRARVAGTMLPLNQNVTAQIFSGCEQHIFRRVAALRYEEKFGRARRGDLQDESLIIAVV